MSSRAGARAKPDPGDALTFDAAEVEALARRGFLSTHVRLVRELVPHCEKEILAAKRKGGH